MALPKRRRPKAKQRSRRGHQSLKVPQLVRERSGGFRVNHTAGVERDRKGRPVQEPEL